MPIYEYTCQKCGTEFEELVHFEDEKIECPVCHSHKVEKHLSAFAFGRACGESFSALSSSCGTGSFG
jgi:putative FmdB family regulatory protein